MFKSNRQVQTVINLIIRYYQNVNDALNAGVLAPRISESGIRDRSMVQWVLRRVATMLKSLVRR